MVVLLVVIAAAVVIFMFVEPTEVTVTRTIMIKAPKEAVFAKMSHFKQWPQWSPWYKLDTTAKIDYTGTDGEAGSSYHWVGNDKIGEGTMTSKAVTGGRMDYHLDFVKPFESKADGYFKVEDTVGMTKATWSFTTHMSRPMNAMQVFMNMDKMLGKDFENGLNNLKTLVEVQGSSTAGGDAEVKEVDFPGHMYAGVRKTVGWDEIGKFCSESYPMAGKALGPKISGPAASIYYTWDTVGKKTDMAAVFPVTDTTAKMKGISYMQLPASKAFMGVHKGGYGSIGKDHEAIRKYMAGKGKSMTVCIEENMVSMPQEPDSNKWVTNIYYLTK